MSDEPLSEFITKQYGLHEFQILYVVPGPDDEDAEEGEDLLLSQCLLCNTHLHHEKRPNETLDERLTIIDLGFQMHADGLAHDEHEGLAFLEVEDDNEGDREED